MDEILRRLAAIEARLDRLQRLNHYRGVSAIDFTTTTLPHEGDWGFQTADDEYQVNADGVILAVELVGL